MVSQDMIVRQATYLGGLKEKVIGFKEHSVKRKI